MDCTIDWTIDKNILLSGTILFHYVQKKEKKPKNISAAIKGHFVDHPKNEQQSLSDELFKKN